MSAECQVFADASNAAIGGFAVDLTAANAACQQLENVRANGTDVHTADEIEDGVKKLCSD